MVPTNPTAAEKISNTAFFTRAGERFQRTQKPNTHIKRVLGGQPGLLKKVGAVVNQINPAEDLGAVDADGDLGAAAVGGVEAVPVGAAGLNLALEAVRLGDDGQRGRHVDLGRGQAAQRVLGLGHAAHADQPPRALGHEEHARQDDEDPEPCACETGVSRFSSCWAGMYRFLFTYTAGQTGYYKPSDYPAWTCRR